MDQRKMPSWADRPANPNAATARPVKPQYHHQESNDANLPAFFHVKGPDGSAGYTGAAPDDTRVLTREDDPATFTKLWGNEGGEGIQMDRVSMFSVTPQRIADDMTRLLLRLDGINDKSSIITDGTACVGGNTVSFAKFFPIVNAIEMDDKRCDMLHNNVQVMMNKNTNASTVRVYCDNCLELIPRLRQDIVFLDPPWGGKDYKSKQTVALFLSAKPLHEVVLYCLRYATYVAVKLPKNAEISQVSQDCRISQVFLKDFGSFSLMVVSSPLGKRNKKNVEEDVEQEMPKMANLLQSLVKTKGFCEILKTTAMQTQKV